MVGVALVYVRCRYIRCRIGVCIDMRQHTVFEAVAPSWSLELRSLYQKVRQIFKIYFHFVDVHEAVDARGTFNVQIFSVTRKVLRETVHHRIGDELAITTHGSRVQCGKGTCIWCTLGVGRYIRCRIVVWI